MKKLYSLFLLAVLAVASASAQATWTFVTNLADAVVIDNGVSKTTLPKGESTIEVGSYASVYMTAAEGYAFEEVKVTKGNEWAWWQNENVYQASNYSNEALTTEITAVNLKEARTEEFTINVDGDIDYVKAALTGKFTSYLNFNELESPAPGTYTVKYAPEYEATLLVEAQNGSPRNVYRVHCGKYNEFRLEEYNVPLTPGCVVDIEQAYPADAVANVKISGNLETVNYYTISNVGYREYELPASGSFQTTLDDEVTLNLKSTEYKFEYISVNGVKNTNFYGNSFAFNVDQNPTTVEIAAHPFGELEATVNVNIAAGVVCQMTGDDYSSIIVDLKDGENTVTVGERNPSIGFKLNGGYELVSASMTVNGETTDLSYIGYITVVDGMTIDIEVKAKEYDYNAIVYVNNIEAAMGGYSMPSISANDYTDNFSLVDGYQAIGLSKLPQQLYLNPGNSQESTYVYLNGQTVTPQWGSYYLDVAENNSVIKVFYNEEPTECEVTFDIDPTTFTYLAQDFSTFPEDKVVTCFEGTAFQVAGADIDVYCNDVKIEANEGAFKFPAELEEGMKVYTMYVEDPETTITVKVASGVENVAVDAIEANAKIYNLQGVQVGEGSLENLPAGIYIRGGKKVMK